MKTRILLSLIALGTQPTLASAAVSYCSGAARSGASLDFTLVEGLSDYELVGTVAGCPIDRSNTTFSSDTAHLYLRGQCVGRLTLSYEKTTKTIYAVNERGILVGSSHCRRLDHEPKYPRPGVLVLGRVELKAGVAGAGATDAILAAADNAEKECKRLLRADFHKVEAESEIEVTQFQQFFEPYLRAQGLFRCL